MTATSRQDTPEPIGRLDHVGIAVHSIEKALTFYEGVLGARLRRTGEDRRDRKSVV